MRYRYNISNQWNAALMASIPMSYENSQWDVSPPGQLIANYCNMNKEDCTGYRTAGDYPIAAASFGSSYFGDIGDGPALRAWQSAYNQAYGRYRGRLRKGGASLGVALGTYKQSREMVVNRSNQLADLTDKQQRALLQINRNIHNRGPAGRQARAALRVGSSLYLETIFGWVPLMQDMWAAANTVVQGAPLSGWMTGRGKGDWIDTRDWPDPYGGLVGQCAGDVTVTVAAGYSVSNPNLWLAERSGLLNPAAVAWDLVPASFLANWFGNFGQIIGSITDFAGLSFENESVTTTYRREGNHVAQRTAYYPTTTSVTWRESRKVRSVGDIPAPSFQFKLPDVNWGMAQIAFALVGQRINTVLKLFR